jgi:hypothetical protein
MGSGPNELSNSQDHAASGHSSTQGTVQTDPATVGIQRLDRQSSPTSQGQPKVPSTTSRGDVPSRDVRSAPGSSKPTKSNVSSSRPAASAARASPPPCASHALSEGQVIMLALSLVEQPSKSPPIKATTMSRIAISSPQFAGASPETHHSDAALSVNEGQPDASDKAMGRPDFGPSNLSLRLRVLSFCQCLYGDTENVFLLLSGGNRHG